MTTQTILDATAIIDEQPGELTDLKLSGDGIGEEDSTAAIDASVATTDVETLIDHEAKSRRLAIRAGELKEEHKKAKALASCKKKLLDDAYDQLRKHARQRPENETLWGVKSEGDEEWREATLSDLGITGAVVGLMSDANITTLGDITDHTKAGKRLVDITGIGQANADKIADALLVYWVKHPRHAGDAISAETNNAKSK